MEYKFGLVTVKLLLDTVGHPIEPCGDLLLISARHPHTGALWDFRLYGRRTVGRVHGKYRSNNILFVFHVAGSSETEHTRYGVTPPVLSEGWLKLANCHVGLKVGWVKVGRESGKLQDIDLLNAARWPLFEYLRHGGRDPDDHRRVLELGADAVLSKAAALDDIADAIRQLRLSSDPESVVDEKRGYLPPAECAKPPYRRSILGGTPALSFSLSV